MREMEDNSIETIITDPPYWLSFMWKKRDYEVPSIEIRQEALRVLKPWGTALIFAWSRTQHRMACNVEDAGFILKDTIMWMYGSWFPKSHNVAKAVDKIQGNEREKVDKVFPDGSKPRKTANQNFYTWWDDKHSKATYTKGTTEREGRGTALKPAYEPILVCQKSNDWTYANNALKWGVSGLNIDGGRIEIDLNNEDRARSANTVKKTSGIGFDGNKKNTQETPLYNLEQWRFPANIILDEEAGRILDEQSGELKTWWSPNNHKWKYWFWYFQIDERKKLSPNWKWYAWDKWWASRFFKNISLDSRMVYVAKASKKERNAGCEGLEEKVGSNGNKWTDQDYRDNEKKPTTKRQNHHPTVKPIKLMEYLCTLTKTPTWWTVLDPFMGSWTTWVACKNTWRDFIGIEMDEEYMEIAKARIWL
jgi:DNA modification methylase